MFPARGQRRRQACPHVPVTASGLWSLPECLRSGLAAGDEAANDCGFASASVTLPTVGASATNSDGSRTFVAGAGRSRTPTAARKQFLDFQNDTSAADVRLAVREGYRNVEHVKRYTRHSASARTRGSSATSTAWLLLAECLGEDDPGCRHDHIPARLHARCLRRRGRRGRRWTCIDPGAQDGDPRVRTTRPAAPFEAVGHWHASLVLPASAGEDLHAAVARECLADAQFARHHGCIDARQDRCPVVADAVEFLDRIYTHEVSAGCRSAAAPTASCWARTACSWTTASWPDLAEQQFYLTTTTGGAARMSWPGWKSWLQTEWPELEVYLTSLTDHYSTIAVAGPNSQERCCKQAGCDTSILKRTAFPFMTVQADRAGRASRCRLFRVSFRPANSRSRVNVDSNAAPCSCWQTVDGGG